MTTDDGELTNSYPENNPDGDVAYFDEYLKRGHTLNRLLGIIRLTSSRDTLVDTDILLDPELDESEFLDEEGTQIYQSLIGSAKWFVQLGLFDIVAHIMTLSSFLAQPRHGHLDRIKRIIGFSSKINNPAIRIRKDMADLSDVAIERQSAEGLRYTSAYGYMYIPDKINPSSILGKHWSYRNIWNMLRLLLFWHSYWGIDRTVGECPIGTIRCTCTRYFPT